MYLIAGLGNPGTQYEHTRHNVGFLFADALHKYYSFSPWRKKFQAEISEGSIGEEKLLLIKPQSFMNLSGACLAQILNFYKQSTENLWVIHDEIALIFGEIRFKKGGSAAGHNGLRSIDQHCNNNYWRLRMGIGHPGVKELVSPYVLGRFSAEELATITKLINLSVENFSLLLEGKGNDFLKHISMNNS